MASAYAGNCILAPIFGVVAEGVGVWLLPGYLLGILGVMWWMQERLNRICPVKP
jgi:hypothetical protein